MLQSLPVTINNLSDITNGIYEPDHLPHLGNSNPNSNPGSRENSKSPSRSHSSFSNTSTSTNTTGIHSPSSKHSHPRTRRDVSVKSVTSAMMLGSNSNSLSTAAGASKLPQLDSARSVQLPGLEGHRGRISVGGDVVGEPVWERAD